MAGNQGQGSIMADVADLIATFVEGQGEEHTQKESILGELANRVLNRYWIFFLNSRSSIHSAHAVEPEFLIDEIKRHLILATGSNRKAVEFDMAAQRFLIDVLYSRSLSPIL